MGDPYVDNENNSRLTSSKVNKDTHSSGGSLGSFPVHRRESGSMTDVTGESMYLQQRKCETCSSSLMGPSIKSNW